MARQQPEEAGRPINPTLSDLCAVAAHLDVTVHKHHLEAGLLGFYEPSEARVYFDFGLTPTEERSVVAHELGHVYYGHVCDSEAHERQAWAFAADLLVDVREYARLEREGMNVHDIAEHLGVTTRVVLAFQEHHLQQLGDITYGRKLRGRFTNAVARMLA